LPPHIPWEDWVQKLSPARAGVGFPGPASRANRARIVRMIHKRFIVFPPSYFSYLSENNLQVFLSFPPFYLGYLSSSTGLAGIVKFWKMIRYETVVW
jgi:hypothetical protein